MTDLPSSLGIEAVQCVSEGGRTLTVRVTGRWRRRRPELRGQPMLVLETAEGRQRFLAMPEPPSLTGAAPGTWRMTFSVPAALAPALPGRTFLQLGGVMVPLPIGEVEIAPERPPPEVAEEPRASGSELAAEVARRRAAELTADVERLERELAEARQHAERQRESIDDRDRRLRAAEQHAHAERALRADLEQDLARQTRVAEHDLRVLHERVAELEGELGRMRRVVDEAQHLAAAAEAARAEAEDRVAGSPPPVGDPPRPRVSRRELELHRSARRPGPPADPPVPVRRAADRTALRLEAAMGRRRDEQADSRLAALEAELGAAREEIETQRRRTARAYAAIESVRAELREIRVSAPAPPPAPTPLRDPVVRMVAPPAPIQAERLAEALARLRDRTPAEPAADPPPAPPAEPSLAEPPPAEPSLAEPPPAEPSSVEPPPGEPSSVEPPPGEPSPAEPPPSPPTRPAKPWLEKPFRALAGSDPTAAGRLLLALLPAQQAADPRAVAYDLVLGDLVCAQVTVGSGTIHVELAGAPRPAAEVDFQLVGDLARVARVLVAGPLRRRLPSRRRARIRGDRRRMAALEQLVRAQLTLGELIAAGVKLDPLLALTLAARAIDASWTAGERFTMAHRDPAATAPGTYLHVRDAQPTRVSAEPPHGPLATVVVCPADDLLGVLAGREAHVEGVQRPLALVRQWLDRAQCG